VIWSAILRSRGCGVMQEECPIHERAEVVDVFATVMRKQSTSRR
jgi:hypothetical protein